MVDWKKLRKKTGHNLNKCILKELYYVSSLAKNNLEVILPNGSIHILECPKRIKLSSTLFERKYSCLDYKGCDLCCIGFHSLFNCLEINSNTERVIKQHNPNIIKIKVNGKEFKYFDINHENPDSNCNLNKKGQGCQVHNENPITCMFPLIHFRQFNKNEVRIVKTYYGRNWAMHCPVKFNKYKNYEEYIEDTLWKFVRLKKYIKILNVDTHINTIIKQLQYRKFKTICN